MQWLSKGHHKFYLPCSYWQNIAQDTGNSYCVLAEEGRPLFVDHQDLLVDWHSMDDPISKGALLVPYILMLCRCDLYESDFSQGIWIWLTFDHYSLRCNMANITMKGTVFGAIRTITGRREDFHYCFASFLRRFRAAGKNWSASLSSTSCRVCNL